jgi:bacterioferritin
MFKNDEEAESGAVKKYQSFIKISLESGDAGTRELFEHILGDEEEHLDWIEAQQDQIKQMGVENYLAVQIKETE